MNICRFRRTGRLDRGASQDGRVHRQDFMVRHHSPGFSLVELLIAMAVGLIILGAVYSLFTLQSKQLGNQELIVEMQQNARMAMEMISRQVRMAGYNPTGATPKPGIVAAGVNSITFSMDVTDTSDSSKQPDGFTDGPNEYITYDLYTPSGGTQYLARRSTSSASRQPVVEHVDLLSFSYLYLQTDGTLTTNNTGLANIREIQITIRTIASKIDPSYTANGGYRTYSLTARVAPRNLAY